MQNLSVEGTKNLAIKTILVRDKLVDLSTPIVMGILNVTPDSFYSKSRMSTEKEILQQAEKMLFEGARIVDIGGYSSRPGAENISPKEELNRVLPAIRNIRKEFPELIISLDTFRSTVANEGLLNGADIINDISGFSIDTDLVDVVAKNKAPYILMHMRGTPQNMQDNTDYENIFTDMVLYFSTKIDILIEKGVNDIIIDPGFGFSKTIEQNHYLLQHLKHFELLEKPILSGISRKSMIYKKLGITPEESLNGTIALNAIALNNGASILRVHDVKEASDLIKLVC